MKEIEKKPERRIFQPNSLTDIIMKGACDKNNDGESNSDFINRIILSYYTPRNECLRREVDFIFWRIKNNEVIKDYELKICLANCVRSLKDNPISEAKPLEDIFCYFIDGENKTCYDYFKIVKNFQDDRLQHLNDILKTLDNDYPDYSRELGIRSKSVFLHWSVLQEYSEIYIALAMLIELEDVYYPLDVYTVINLIKSLDVAINNSKLVAIKDEFDTSISNKDRYSCLCHTLQTYYSDNAYVYLSGDINFKKIPDEINKFYDKCKDMYYKKDDISEDDLKEMIQLEREGRRLFWGLNKDGSLK